MDIYRQIIWPLVISSVLIAGCGTTPPPSKAKKIVNTQPKVSPAAPLSAQAFLAKAAVASAEDQASLYVRAADRMIAEEQPAKALALLTEMSDIPLTSQLKKQKQLFIAQALLQLKQPAMAYKLIQDITTVDGFEQRLYQTKMLTALNNQQPFEALANATKLRPYLPAEQQQSLNDAMWQALVALPLAENRQYPVVAQSELSGWFDLLKISEQTFTQPKQLAVKIKHWQAQNPNHPASLNLPAALTQALQEAPLLAQNIAVILPLSGQFSRQGEGIQQGIIAARFAMPQETRPAVTFLDSNSLDFSQLANSEYDFFIGPLLKPNIEKFLQQPLTQPSLVLNEAQLETVTNKARLFSDALSPENEAEQAALAMLKQNLRRPIVLASNDSYGRRMSQAFQTAFTQGNGEIIGTGYFSSPEEMKQTVERLMETASSKQRIKTIKQLLNNPPKYEADARNRRDIDSIYIIGDENETRIIKPYIDVNTAPFAKLVPIYASSRSFSSRLNNADMRDLNHIIFSEMPWLLPGRAGHSPLANQMQLVWNNATDSHARFFAFGYDALTLTKQLTKMKHLPNYRYSGLTGELSLNANQQIVRRLSWAKFNRSRIQNITLASRE